MSTVLLILFSILVGAVVILAAFYFLAPAAMFNMMRNMLRRRGDLEEKSIKVGDMVWPYLENSVADDVPVVLVHGFASDKDAWAMYAPQFKGICRVIVPDLPGHGDNTTDPDRDFCVEAQTRALRDFLDALGIEKCHMTGNSMGGFVALQFAVDCPDRLASLTLIDSAGISTAEGTTEMGEAIKSGNNPLEITGPGDVERLMGLVAHKPQKLPGQFQKVLYTEFAQRRDLFNKIFWVVVEDGSDRSLDHRLGEIGAPTLIIWGDKDSLIDVSTVKVLENGIPDAKAVILKDVGHIPMIENPELTAQHQLPFLAAATARQGA